MAWSWNPDLTGVDEGKKNDRHITCAEKLGPDGDAPPIVATATRNSACLFSASGPEEGLLYTAEHGLLRAAVLGHNHLEGGSCG